MRSFQDIQRYLTQTKEKITSTVKSVWDSYWVQGTIQGLAAPIYSYNSLITTWDESEEVRTSVTRAWELNKEYALHAIGCYFLYYWLMHPLKEYTSSFNSDSLIVETAQGGIAALDFSCYVGILFYLYGKKIQNLPENFAHMHNITYAAAKAMPESKEFKSCTDSGDVKKSILSYAINCFIIDKISKMSASKISGFAGRAISFGIEAGGYGYQLVDYKLSAVGQCAEHRLNDIFANKKWFVSMFGASFVLLLQSLVFISNKISGAENDFSYDAIFSFLFQLYALASITRQDVFPSHEGQAIDIMGGVKYLAKTHAGQYMLEILLKDLCSLERLVQMPGVSYALTLRDDEIKSGLQSVKGGIKQVEGSRLLYMAKWINKLIPFIPHEAKKLFKLIDKNMIRSWISTLESLLALSRTAEEQRKNPQKKVEFNRMDDQYFAHREIAEEQHCIPELKPAATPLLTIEESNPEPVSLDVEVKQENLTPPMADSKIAEIQIKVTPPTEQKKTEESPVSLTSEPSTPIINENYFQVQRQPISPLVKLEEKATVKPRDSMMSNNSNLFHKKKIELQFDESSLLQRRKKDQSFAALTTLIMSSNAGRSKKGISF